MTVKQNALALAASATLAFALGRYTAPEKVKTEIKTVEVEKKVDKTDVDQHKETTVTETQKPDGTKETVTKVTEDTNTQTKSAETNKTATDDKKEITYGSNKVTIQALAGVGGVFSSPLQSTYGLSVSRPLLGPIVMGVWGINYNGGVGGLSMGVQF